MSTSRPFYASISTWECLALLLLLPVVAFPAGPQAALLLVIPFFWLLHLVYGEGLFPRTPFNLALAVIGIMLLISLTMTFDFQLSLTKMAGILYGIALLMATSRLMRSQRRAIWWVLSVVLLIGVAAAVAGLVGVRWLPPFHPLNSVGAWLPADLQAIPGAVGGVINENELAGTLAWIAPMFVAGLVGLPRSVSKYGRLLAILLAAGALLLAGIIIATQSRAGVLALLLSTALVVSLFVPRQWRLVMLVLATVVSVAWYFSYGSALDATAPGADTLGLSSRLEIWSRALVAIGDFPLTGVSVNGFRAVLQVLYPTFQVPQTLDLGHAHNHILQAALDLGLPGMVGYLALWIVSAGMLARTLRRLTRAHMEDHPTFALTVGLAGSLTAGWVFGLLDTIALGARPGFIWWLLIALAGGSHYLVMYQMGIAGQRRRATRVEGAPGKPVVAGSGSLVTDGPGAALAPAPEALPGTPKADGASPASHPDSRPKSRPRMRYRPPSDS